MAAICGSIVTNLVVLTLTAIFGTLILNAMPAAVSNALSNYILPGMFGAMLAMFGCSAPILTIPVFAVLIVVNVLADKGFLGPGRPLRSPSSQLSAPFSTPAYSISSASAKGKKSVQNKPRRPF